MTRPLINAQWQPVVDLVASILDEHEQTEAQHFAELVYAWVKQHDGTDWRVALMFELIDRTACLRGGEGRRACLHPGQLTGNETDDPAALHGMAVANTCEYLASHAQPAEAIRQWQSLERFGPAPTVAALGALTFDLVYAHQAAHEQWGKCQWGRRVPALN